MPRPSREEVYEAWIKVIEMEKALAAAQAEHQRLADARYGNGNAEQLRDDRVALGL